MRLSARLRTFQMLGMVLGMVLGMAMALPVAQATTESGVAEDSAADGAEPALDASLTPKGSGCEWRAPPAPAAPAGKKRGHKAHGRPTVPRIFVSVPCKTIKVVAVRGDGRKAAITAASEGAPKSVETSPGTLAMVYPLSYRLFEADLTSGKVAEFGLPKLKFPSDTRPAVAVGYNSRDALVIVATGLTENDSSILLRFVPGRQGWTALPPLTFKTDGEQDAHELCGEKFLIRASLLKDLVNWCVKS